MKSSGVERVRAVADGRPRQTAVSPFAHLLPLFTARTRGEARGPEPVSFAHLLPGLPSASRAAGRRRAAALPVTTAVPPTHEPMGTAERRAFHAAARAENARWAAVMAVPRPAHLIPAAINLLSTTRASAASVNDTLAMIAQTTPPPSVASRPPRTGAERLAARVAEHQASVAAALSPSAEVAALAERADAANFASFAARTMAKVRNPDAPTPSMPLRSPR